MKIPINMIDANRYQIREKHDEDIIASIAVSALGRHGILQSPMVRLIKETGRFETVYGHGRVRAAKVAGITELECRVESDVTDREMRLYMGQENVLRGDLSETERMAWLEQVQEDMGLTVGERGFWKKLHAATALPLSTIEEAYFTKEVRIRLRSSAGGRVSDPPIRMIRNTRPLGKEDQVRLIIKSMDKGWSSTTALNITKAITKIDPELRARLLDEETDLPWKVMVALAEIENAENALKLLEYILKRRLIEKVALRILEDAKKGIYPTYNVEYSDQFESALRSFQVVNVFVAGWGAKKFELVKDHWDVIEPILTKIETNIQEFRRLNRRVL